jgi:hypothetical protein
MWDTLKDLWKRFGLFRWGVILCLLATLAPLSMGGGGCAGPFGRPCNGEKGDLVGRWEMRGEKPLSSAVTVNFAGDGSFVPNVKRRDLPELDYTLNGGELSFFRPVSGRTSGLLSQRGLVRWVNGCEFLYKVVFDSSGVRREGWVYRFKRR